MNIKIVISQEDGTMATFESSDWQSVKQSAESYLALPESFPLLTPTSQKSNPITAALYIRTLGEQGFTQKQIAQRFGVNQSTISNSLRLLELPENIQALVKQGKLSRGHGVALCGLMDWPQEQERLAKQTVSEKWPSRYLETIVAQFKEKHKDLQKKF